MQITISFDCLQKTSTISLSITLTSTAEIKPNSFYSTKIESLFLKINMARYLLETIFRIKHKKLQDLIRWKKQCDFLVCQKFNKTMKIKDREGLLKCQIEVFRFEGSWAKALFLSTKHQLHFLISIKKATHRFKIQRKQV